MCARVCICRKLVLVIKMNGTAYGASLAVATRFDVKKIFESYKTNDIFA